MKKFLFVSFTMAAITPALALEVDPLVPPEINLGGRALATVNSTLQDTTTTGGETDSELDISDSSLLFGFSKYLFSNVSGQPNYGFGVIGLTRPDHTSELNDEIYLHEINAGIGGRNYEVKLGRSRLRNNLVRFPTARDDDLLAFTHVPNAAANTEADVYQVFGGVADVQWWPTPKLATHATLTSRVETDALGNETANSNLNGIAAGIAYSLPQSLKFDRGLRFAGVTFDSQQIDALNDERLHAVIGGLIYNLNDNPEADWVWETQAIANGGVDNVASLATPVNRARAKSTSLVTALRFNKRPYLQTRWQAALTLAWKDYRDVADATSYAVAPSFLYRLGSGVDWITQYIYTRNGDGLAQATGVESEHRLYTGLSFAFDHTFNESVGERGSILAIEHNMAVSGPSLGGH